MRNPAEKKTEVDGKIIGNPPPRPAFPCSVKVLVVASDHNRAIQIHLSRIKVVLRQSPPSPDVGLKLWQRCQHQKYLVPSKWNEAQPLLPSPAGSPLPDITSYGFTDSYRIQRHHQHHRHPKASFTCPIRTAVQSLPPGGHPSAHAPGVGPNESPLADANLT